VVLNIRRRFRQLFNDERIRWIGGIAHAQVDHVLTRATLLIEQRIDPPEQVGWQTVHARSEFDAKRSVCHFSSKAEAKNRVC
jgi:hypothetical protein